MGAKGSSTSLHIKNRTKIYIRDKKIEPICFYIFGNIIITEEDANGLETSIYWQAFVMRGCTSAFARTVCDCYDDRRL
jgi:hypothetical protein